MTAKNWGFGRIFRRYGDVEIYGNKLNGLVSILNNYGLLCGCVKRTVEFLFYRCKMINGIFEFI